MRQASRFRRVSLIWSNFGCLAYFFYPFFQGGYDCDTTPCHRLHAVFGAGGLGTFDEVATETSLPSGRPNAQGFWPASWYQLV